MADAVDRWLRARDANRKVRRTEEKADPGRPVGPASDHRQRRADAVRGDEAELARGCVVATACDQDVPELSDRRAASIPIRERKQRVTRASAAVRLERTCVCSSGALGFGEGGRVGSRRPGCREEGAVRLLRRMAEVTLEAMQEDRRPAFRDRERVPPESQGKAEPEIRAQQWIGALARKIRRRTRNSDADGVEL